MGTKRDRAKIKVVDTPAYKRIDEAHNKGELLLRGTKHGNGDVKQFQQKLKNLGEKVPRKNLMIVP